MDKPHHEQEEQPVEGDSLHAGPTLPATRRRRRWLQYGLRSLFVLTLLCAAGAFAWRTCLEPYRQQRQTMALIETLGGTYQTGEASGWLRFVYGADFQNVALVNLADGDDPATYLPAIAGLPKLETLVVGGPTFGDEQLRGLQGATALRNLVLDSTAVTDDALAAWAAARPEVVSHRSDRRTMALLEKRGATARAAEPNGPAELRQLLGDACLARCAFVGFPRGSGRARVPLDPGTDEDLALLAGLTEIQILGLDDAQISDEGLAHLKRLNKLHKLHLGRTPIGDAALEHLKHLGALQILDLDGTRITDAGLLHLKEIGTLQWLLLGDTTISDAGLENLKEFPNLQSLSLDATRITDAGLAHLSGFSRLLAISLERTQITDAGLVHLKRLENLQSLSLNCTKISDAGLVHVAELSKLRYLYLSGTQVSDTGLAHLKRLEQLQSLALGRMLIDKTALPEVKPPGRNTSSWSLHGPRITDAGIAQLKRLDNLSTLDLSDTEISDAGLAELKKLAYLTRLELGNMRISDAALANFKQALPMCQVIRHGGMFWPAPRR